MTAHRIAHCDFSQGEAQCTCGEWVTTEPRFDRNEMLALAWLAHRREAAAGKAKPIEYEHGGAIPVFHIRRQA